MRRLKTREPGGGIYEKDGDKMIEEMEKEAKEALKDFEEKTLDPLDKEIASLKARMNIKPVSEMNLKEKIELQKINQRIDVLEGEKHYRKTGWRPKNIKGENSLEQFEKATSDETDEETLLRKAGYIRDLRPTKEQYES